MKFRVVNLLDRDMVDEIISEFRPDYVLHLASFSSVAFSWEHPVDCFNNNTNIFLNITESIRACGLEHCRILSVGSSEEYGNVTEDQIPLREDMKLYPVSPYAVARVSQEMLAKVLVDGYGMKIILTRSFNHMGPFQDGRFVIPSFIRRVLDIKAAGNDKGEIETGDISIIRDFVDVRDVVRAYYLLLTEGTPGEVYNICGGKGVALSQVIDEIADLVGVTVETKVNPQFVRPGDNKIIIGSADKIQQELQWKAEIPLRQTLQDMIENMQ
jgi:GDP-4-dehydro-6-deoxy-D-mannose reductase